MHRYIFEETEETIAPSLWQRMKKFLFNKFRREKKRMEIEDIRKTDQVKAMDDVRRVDQRAEQIPDRTKLRSVGDGGEVRRAYPPSGKPIKDPNPSSDSRPNVVYTKIKTVRQAARANRINRQLYGR